MIKNFIKKYLNVGVFASASLPMQILVLLFASLLVIFLFGVFYTTFSHSFLIFMEPTEILRSKNFIETTFGFVELIIGLFIGGALISIITSTLTELTTAANNGFITYKEKDHIIIINENFKLDFVIEEINQYAKDEKTIIDIAIFLPYCDNILAFNKNLKKYSHLIIKVLAGDVLSWQSYQRLNINHANKILLLDHEGTDNENIMISRFILTHKNFTNDKLDFVIDAETEENLKEVYESIFHNRQKQLFLTQSNQVLKQIISRTLVNYDYFFLFSHLLSFVGWEFYVKKASAIYDKKIKFSKALSGQRQAILAGIVTKDGVNLNPPKDTMIDHKQDKLILIAECSHGYDTEDRTNNTNNTITIRKPLAKEHKKIYIVGNKENLELSSITEFLSAESIKQCQKIVCEDNKYNKQEMWDKIVDDKPDIVILDLEDEQEFIVTMFLRNLYSGNKKFLSTIVNIIHDPDIATLMIGADTEKNIIMTEQLIAKYLSQYLFNPQIPAIFDELTTTSGSEFYILEKPKYDDLFEMDYDTLRVNLVQNDMIYIGIFTNDDEFVFNSKEIHKGYKIAVLSEGVR